MAAKTHRALPHENIPLKYQDSDEPMSGTPSNVAKAPDKQKVGYDLDVTLDWEAIVKKLASEGFKLNYDGTLEYITVPDLPKGVEMKARQLMLRGKAYAKALGRRNLIGVLASDALTEYQQKVTKCLYNPAFSKTELKALGAYVKEWELPEQEVSDRNWRGIGGQSAYGAIPRKVLPGRDQFTESVKSLEFGDIFTIFKGASLEQLKLFIGRVILGHPGTLDFETKGKLTHTYRNIMVIDGAYAGQGKSTIFSKLAGALARVGFKVNQACPDLSGRFNHGEAFTSDFILRDDITTDHLGKELSSPNAKILATNGIVATEQKGENAVTTKCTAAMMILANRCEQKLFWGMDDGMRSRVTLCGTEPEGSVPDELLPQFHIKALAERFGVEEDTIMLWACRLAADEFAMYINENAYKLEGRIKELQDMSNNSSSDPLDGTLAALLLGYMLEKGEAPPVNLNKEVLALGLKGMLAIKQTPDVAKLLGDTVKIPAWSPAQGMKWVNPASILTSHNILTSQGVSCTPNKLIKLAFEALSLRDGNQCYGTPSAVLPRWSNLISNKFTLERIKGVYDTMKEAYAPHKGRFHSDINYQLDIFWNS